MCNSNVFGNNEKIIDFPFPFLYESGKNSFRKSTHDIFYWAYIVPTRYFKTPKIQKWELTLIHLYTIILCLWSVLYNIILLSIVIYPTLKTVSLAWNSHIMLYTNIKYISYSYYVLQIKKKKLLQNILYSSASPVTVISGSITFYLFHKFFWNLIYEK